MASDRNSVSSYEIAVTISGCTHAWVEPLCAGESAAVFARRVEEIAWREARKLYAQNGRCGTLDVRTTAIRTGR